MLADVIVVGLGSMGGAAAWQLARRGLRVIGLDQFHPPHAGGAHAGESRIFRMAYMEGAGYVPLLRRSVELWAELAAATGSTVLSTTGGLMLGRPDSVAVAGAHQAALACGLAHELLDADAIRHRFPAFAPAPDEIGLFEEAAGVLRPEQTVTAHLELARRAGAQLRLGVPVLGWRAGPDGVVVATGEEELHAGWLVLAPGPWAAQLTELNLPLQVQRRVQFYWAPQPLAPYQPDQLPVWIWEFGPGLAAYGLPAVDGRVKAAMHHGDNPADPAMPLAPASAEEIAQMRAWLASRLPGLARAELVGSTPCRYTLTPDGHFVVGLHPHHPRTVLACGFSGHGFKFVPVIAEILADLVTTGSTRHPIGLFDPARFGPPDWDPA